MKVQSSTGLRVLVLLLVSIILACPTSIVGSEPSANTATVAELNAKLSKLDIETATLGDVTQLLGEPLMYSWRRKTLNKDNLPPVYNVKYPNELNLAIEHGRVSSVQFYVPGFFYRGSLQVGSSMEDVYEVVGEPTKTLVGEERPSEDSVLYQDIGGRNGIGYYRRSEEGVAFFIRNNKVAAIYLTPSVNCRTLLSPKGSLAIVRHPSAPNIRKTKLSSYDPTSQDAFQVDLRGGDVSNEDLQGRLGDLIHASFDDRTIWPARLPEGFAPVQMMNLGRNPGLKVRQLHHAGIAGKGVGIGILDTTLLVDHVEYRDRLRLYEEIHCPDGGADMHGAAVASIAVGKTVGVAPEADLYFITAGTWSPGTSAAMDFRWVAKSIDRLLEINRTLPPERKIRVISISSGWSPDRKGYEEADRAVERAKQEGVFVITTRLHRTHKLAFHGLGRDPLADPDEVHNYGPGSWWCDDFFNGDGWGVERGQEAELAQLMVPMDSRCVASPTGPEHYVFYAQGGWSWSVPYLAGLYALACQAKPTVTPNEFWSVGLETGTTVTVERDGKTRQLGKIVDPVALIRALSG